MFSKILIILIIFLKKIIPLQKTLNHKYLNKNQITDLKVVMNSLRNRGYYPTNIVDVGCFEGVWTKNMMNIFSNSNYYLFDADNSNFNILNNISKLYSNVKFKICLLSDDIKDYYFYKMKSGSSIFFENTSYPRQCVKLKSTTLSLELDKMILNTDNNLIKIDAQGSEIKILKGLKNHIYNFEILVLEVSLHEYNKGSPLFNEVFKFMDSKKFKLYDIFDLKRFGENKSFLFQYDAVFVRQNSNLLKVKF